MATWDEFADYVRRSYKIAKDEGTFMVLSFDLGGGRSQNVMLSRGTMGASDQEWAIVASGFAEVGAIRDFGALLVEASEYVVGGVVQYGTMLAYRHAIPLGTLDIGEFTEPFELVIHTADSLEQKFGLGDSF